MSDLNSYLDFLKLSGFTTNKFSLKIFVDNNNYIGMAKYLHTLTKLLEQTPNIMFYSTDIITSLMYCTDIIDHNILKNVEYKYKDKNLVVFLKYNTIKKSDGHIVIDLKTGFENIKSWLKMEKQKDDTCCICFEDTKAYVSCYKCSAIICYNCNKNYIKVFCPVCKTNMATI